MMMRSQYRLTERNALLTVVDGSTGSSTCCRAGSGRRLAKVSTAINSNRMRLEFAAPAAVTMFVAPGPTDEVATMIWRRCTVFVQEAAANAMPC